MEIEAKVPLVVIDIVGDSQALKKAPVDVLHQLSAAIVPFRTKVPTLPSVTYEMTITFIIGKAMEAKFKFYRDLLACNVVRQVKRLQVSHAVGALPYFYVIPLHLDRRRTLLKCAHCNCIATAQHWRLNTFLALRRGAEASQ